MSEVGIIGQMYENRKSKKIGVLESRDEKFKTLLFRGDDGSSFNVNYSTFKSNWRKYEGDKLIQTSTQVEDAKEEAAAEAAEAEKIVKKAAVKRISKVEKFKLIRDLQLKTEEIVAGRFIVGTDSRGCVAIKQGNRKFAELWLIPEYSAFEMAIREDIYTGAKLSFMNDVEFKDNWRLPYLVRGISLEYAADTIKYLVDTVATYLASKNSEDSEDSATGEEE